MSKKTAQKAKPPKLPRDEAEQVRIRREIGHDFALKDDRFGRKRLSVGTEEARRVYEVSTAATPRPVVSCGCAMSIRSSASHR